MGEDQQTIERGRTGLPDRGVDRPRRGDRLHAGRRRAVGVDRHVRGRALGELSVEPPVVTSAILWYVAPLVVGC
jgi:hypothetical protein